MADLDFVHLHVHSSYSLLEGALPIARLAELAKADKQPALALTDTDNMFGALEFSEKIAGYGIQPIIGCALSLDFGDTDNGARNGNAQNDRQRIVLLAASEEGYRSLMRLNSRAFMESPANEPPRLKVEWLEGETDGIIALTGGPGGPLDMAIAAGQSPVAATRLDTLHRLFGDRLYVELQRHGAAHERMTEPVLIDFAYSRGMPLVATNEPFFATAADYEAHDALICIAEGRYVARNRPPASHGGASLQDPRRDARTVRRSAGGARLDRRDRAALRLPPAHAQADPAALLGRRRRRMPSTRPSELRTQAEAGLDAAHRQRRSAPTASPRSNIASGCDFELDVIDADEISGLLPDRRRLHHMGEERRHSGRARPRFGRGLAGRLCADHHRSRSDALRPAVRTLPQSGTRVDAGLRHRLLPGPPRRGDPTTCRSATAATRSRRSSPSAPCRRAACCATSAACLQMPYGQVDKLCKMVPQNPAKPVTLARAIEDEPKLQAEADNDPTVKRAFAIAMKLEGLTRHASTHAAGIVIGDRALSELVPLYRDPKSDMPVTQFNMKWVEQAGLVKFDFLGLKTLTVLKTAVELLERRGVDSRSRRHPARRQQDLRYAGARRNGRRVPAGKPGHAARARSTCSPTVSRTSSRWSRSTGRVRWRTSRPIARASTDWKSRTTSIPSSSRS